MFALLKQVENKLGELNKQTATIEKQLQDKGCVEVKDVAPGLREDFHQAIRADWVNRKQAHLTSWRNIYRNFNSAIVTAQAQASQPAELVAQTRNSKDDFALSLRTIFKAELNSYQSYTPEEAKKDNVITPFLFQLLPLATHKNPRLRQALAMVLAEADLSSSYAEMVANYTQHHGNGTKIEELVVTANKYPLFFKTVINKIKQHDNELAEKGFLFYPSEVLLKFDILKGKSSFSANELLRKLNIVADNSNSTLLNKCQVTLKQVVKQLNIKQRGRLAEHFFNKYEKALPYEVASHLYLGKAAANKNLKPIFLSFWQNHADKFADKRYKDEFNKQAIDLLDSSEHLATMLLNYRLLNPQDLSFDKFAAEHPAIFKKILDVAPRGIVDDFYNNIRATFLTLDANKQTDINCVGKMLNLLAQHYRDYIVADHSSHDVEGRDIAARESLALAAAEMITRGHYVLARKLLRSKKLSQAVYDGQDNNPQTYSLIKKLEEQFASASFMKSGENFAAQEDAELPAETEQKEKKASEPDLKTIYKLFLRYGPKAQANNELKKRHDTLIEEINTRSAASRPYNSIHAQPSSWPMHPYYPREKTGHIVDKRKHVDALIQKLEQQYLETVELPFCGGYLPPADKNESDLLTQTRYNVFLHQLLNEFESKCKGYETVITDYSADEDNNDPDGVQEATELFEKLYKYCYSEGYKSAFAGTHGYLQQRFNRAYAKFTQQNLACVMQRMEDYNNLSNDNDEIIFLNVSKSKPGLKEAKQRLAVSLERLNKWSYQGDATNNDDYMAPFGQKRALFHLLDENTRKDFMHLELPLYARESMLEYHRCQQALNNKSTPQQQKFYLRIDLFYAALRIKCCRELFARKDVITEFKLDKPVKSDEAKPVPEKKSAEDKTVAERAAEKLSEATKVVKQVAEKLGSAEVTKQATKVAKAFSNLVRGADHEQEGGVKFETLKDLLQQAMDDFYAFDEEYPPILFYALHHAVVASMKTAFEGQVMLEEESSRWLRVFKVLVWAVLSWKFMDKFGQTGMLFGLFSFIAIFWFITEEDVLGLKEDVLSEESDVYEEKLEDIYEHAHINHDLQETLEFFLEKIERHESEPAKRKFQGHLIRDLLNKFAALRYPFSEAKPNGHASEFSDIVLVETFNCKKHEKGYNRAYRVRNERIFSGSNWGDFPLENNNEEGYAKAASRAAGYIEKTAKDDFYRKLYPDLLKDFDQKLTHLKQQLFKASKNIEPTDPLNSVSPLVIEEDGVKRPVTVADIHPNMEAPLFVLLYATLLACARENQQRAPDPDIAYESVFSANFWMQLWISFWTKIVGVKENYHINNRANEDLRVACTQYSREGANTSELEKNSLDSVERYVLRAFNGANCRSKKEYFGGSFAFSSKLANLSANVRDGNLVQDLSDVRNDQIVGEIKLATAIGAKSHRTRVR